MESSLARVPTMARASREGFPGIVLAAFTAAALWSEPARADDVLDWTVAFDILPSPLASALIQFSSQSGIQVAAADADVSHLNTNGVNGTFPIRVALKTLLQGTGLGYSLVGEKTVAIRTAPAESVLGALPVPSGARAAPETPHQDLRLASATQGTQPQPLSEVTVTAPRPPTPEELAGNAVPDFIHRHAAPTVVTEQLARWGIGRDPGICPLTTGFSPSFNDFVSARILAVAAAVGAPTQPTGRCSRHNVYVVFATEPAKALDGMVKQDSRVLGFHYPQQARSLERITHPIQGWYVTTTHGAYGDESIDEAEPLLPLETSILDQGKVPAGLPGSRLCSSISSGIVNVIIVADANNMVGRPIGAIADYVAVLALTQAFASERCGTLPSILDMMTPNCDDRDKLTGITAGDLAFLRALYKTDLETVLPIERSDIHNSMMRQFDRR